MAARNCRRRAARLPKPSSHFLLGRYASRFGPAKCTTDSCAGCALPWPACNPRPAARCTVGRRHGWGRQPHPRGTSFPISGRSRLLPWRQADSHPNSSRWHRPSANRSHTHQPKSPRAIIFSRHHPTGITVIHAFQLEGAQSRFYAGVKKINFLENLPLPGLPSRRAS